jgi:hypothetical protein
MSFRKRRPGYNDSDTLTFQWTATQDFGLSGSETAIGEFKLFSRSLCVFCDEIR